MNVIKNCTVVTDLSVHEINNELQLFPNFFTKLFQARVPCSISTTRSCHPGEAERCSENHSCSHKKSLLACWLNILDQVIGRNILHRCASGIIYFAHPYSSVARNTEAISGRNPSAESAWVRTRGAETRQSLGLQQTAGCNRSRTLRLCA